MPWVLHLIVDISIHSLGYELNFARSFWKWGKCNQKLAFYVNLLLHLKHHAMRAFLTSALVWHHYQALGKEVLTIVISFLVELS